MTDLVAVYAAVVSTLAIAWQVVSWLLAHRTRLSVRISRHRLTDETAGPGQRVTLDNLLISVTNFSEHPVRIARAQIASPFYGRHNEAFLFLPNPRGRDEDATIGGVLDVSSDLAGVIEARDSIDAFVPVSSLPRAGLQPWLPLKAVVQTATGQVFASEVVSFPEERPAAAGEGDEPRPAGRRSRPRPASARRDAPTPRRRRRPPEPG
jgi:hypothetical protein